MGPLDCCSCHCLLVSLLNSYPAKSVFPAPHLGPRMLVPFICALLSCPAIGPKAELGQGTEAIEVFSPSHFQLQLALRHDFPGWRVPRSPVQTVLELLVSLLQASRVALALEHQGWLSQAIRWAQTAFYFKWIEHSWKASWSC